MNIRQLEATRAYMGRDGLRVHDGLIRQVVAAKVGQWSGTGGTGDRRANEERDQLELTIRARAS